MPSQTAIFTRLVRDFMSAPPPTVAADAPCGDAVAAMAGATCAVVTEGGRAVGIVTEQDVVRRIAFRMDAARPVAEAMTAPLRAVRATDRLYPAIAEMRRHRLRHLPVVDAAARPVGTIALDAALAGGAAQMVDQVDRLAHADTIAGMARVKAAQVAVAEQLFADGVPAPDVLGFVSTINADLHGRVAALCLREMAPDLGAAPVPFALIVMGSGGRGESAVGADQDNGAILADYDDADHDATDRWFRAFAERLNEGLDAVGLPLCRGGVMARNPLWRKSLAQWRDQIDLWFARATDTAVGLGSTFMDFRPVYGDAALAARLREHATARAARSRAWLAATCALQRGRPTALGWFGRIRRRDGGALDLKYDALLPLVEAARLWSLVHGIAATGTGERLDALAAAGSLDRDEHDALCAAFALFAELVLRRQIDDVRAGRPVAYAFDPDGLTARRRAAFVDALRAVEGLRDRVQGVFSADLF